MGRAARGGRRSGRTTAGALPDRLGMTPYATARRKTTTRKAAVTQPAPSVPPATTKQHTSIQTDKPADVANAAADEATATADEAAATADEATANADEATATADEATATADEATATADEATFTANADTPTADVATPNVTPIHVSKTADVASALRHSLLQSKDNPPLHEAPAHESTAITTGSRDLVGSSVSVTRTIPVPPVASVAQNRTAFVTTPESFAVSGDHPRTKSLGSMTSHRLREIQLEAEQRQAVLAAKRRRLEEQAKEAEAELASVRADEEEQSRILFFAREQKGEEMMSGDPPVAEDHERWNYPHQLQQPYASSSQSNPRSTLSAPTPNSMTTESMMMMLLQSQTKSLEEMKLQAARRHTRDLPSFSGEPEAWMQFEAAFHESTIRAQLSNAENLHRLQKALKGKAMDSVRAALVHPDNVPGVIDTLKRLFGRPEIIIQAMLDKVKGIKKIRAENFEGVIEFSAAVENLTITVENMKRNSYLYNPQLLHELVHKLPEAQKLNWCHYNVGWTSELTLRHFADWLRHEAEAVVPFSTVFKQEAKKEDRDRGREGYRRHVGAAMVMEDRCEFCKKSGHSLNSCYTFRGRSMDEKQQYIKKNNRCFNCLVASAKEHIAKNCDAPPCGEDDCRQMHHKFFHRRKRSSTPSRKTDDEKIEKTTKIGAINDTTEACLLEIGPVTLSGPKGDVDTYALLDSGAQTSLIAAEMAQALGLKGPHQKLRLSWVNDREETVSSEKVTVNIKGKNKSKWYSLKGVQTYPGLDLDSHTANVNELQQQWPEIDGWDKVNGYQMARPTILIGKDNGFLHNVRDTAGRPAIRNTKIGWIVSGPTLPHASQPKHSTKSFLVKEVTQIPSVTPSLKLFTVRNGKLSDLPEEEVSLDSLEQMVKASFSTEQFGVQVPQRKIQSKLDEQAEQILRDTTRRVDGGWETGLLWKEKNTYLQSNKSDAMRRLRSIEKRMDRDPTFAKQYCAKIQEYFDKGFARPLTAEELKEQDNVWYLPHFNVHNPSKPGKFRIVFDAAAKSNGLSLNDRLLQGPDLYKSLPEVLIGFRHYSVGVTADIKDMFHRIKVIPEDCRAQRFLFRGMERTKPPTEYVLLVIMFGSSSSPTSAHYVKNKNAEEFMPKTADDEPKPAGWLPHRNAYDKAVEAIQNKHYVDDYADSCDGADQTIHRARQIIEIHASGGFEICGWSSNSKEVLQALPAHLVSQSNSSTLNGNRMERILGIHWDPESDCLTFTGKFVKLDAALVTGIRRPTKREALKVIMSIFDPLGFVAHLLVKAKILVQEIWRSGINWDDEISSKIFSKWILWLQELSGITGVRIPRCYDYQVKKAVSIQLHIFVDASELAFAAVAYFRFEFLDRISTSFIMAKSRVAPVRPMSIPRLELQAAVMGSRLAASILKLHEYRIDEVHLWSDSWTVLCWLRSDARNFKVFVAHRVGEIEENSEGGQWHWVPTAENVADEATRDGGSCSFEFKARWFQGPPFLKTTPEQWPSEPQQHALPTDDMLEKKPSTVLKLAVTPPLINFIRFDTWKKLLRSVAWTGRVTSKTVGELTVAELATAEHRVHILAQQEMYGEELRAVRKGDTVPTHSSLYKLSPVLYDDGLLRMNGRISKSSDVDLDVKKPIFMDPHHHVTKLIVAEFHCRFNHQGQETVLNELRQKYWIPSGRSAVRQAAYDCPKCQLDHAQPLTQEMGELPECRVNRQIRPFVETGLDYFGPITVVIGRRHEKRWACLFTCMSTRAVHLEVASKMNTDSCIMAIRRMMARRGAPRKLFSDNGTNFHGADNELKRALAELNQAQLQSSLATSGIEWHFNPPSAPHTGGAWERMVQSVKRALGFVLMDPLPEELLITLLAEAECIVNSRPLTYVSPDPKDRESITPNHFLMGGPSGLEPLGVFSEADLCVRTQWKREQALANELWKRWLKEYLPTLNTRKKWYVKEKELAVGDVVFIADGALPRGKWPKGVVTQTFPGKDGLVRTVDVETADGPYRRHISKIMVPTTHFHAPSQASPSPETTDIQA